MKLRGNIGNMVGKKTPVPTQSTRSRIPVPIGVARGGLRGLGPQRIRKKNIKASLVNLTLNIRYKMTKIPNLSSPYSFFQAQNARKAGGAYDAPPDPLVGWGGDTLSPPFPPRVLELGAYGASVLRPPQHKILTTPVFLSA